jgi:site-specific recombinase XerD
VLSKLKIPGKLHTFRHAFISRALLSGIEEAVVRAWVGHIDPEILKIYTHVASQLSQDRIKRLGSNPKGTNATDSNESKAG